MKLFTSFFAAALAFEPLVLVSAVVRGDVESRGHRTIEYIQTRGELTRRLDGNSSESGDEKMTSKSKSKMMKMKMTKTKLYTGDSIPIGNGELYTVSVIEGKEPVLVGVAFSGASLENLPTAPSDGLRDIQNTAGETVILVAGHEFTLTYPRQVLDAVSPLEHTVVNWNPNGHPPPFVYTIPHLDFHFYAYSAERRERCVKTPRWEDLCPIDEDPGFVNVDCAGLAFLTEPLPGDMEPPGYILVPGPAEAAMGNHLIPVTSAEFNGGDFTHTWIYGVEGGNITFFEPMITIPYLAWLTKVATGDVVDPQDPNQGTIAVSDDGFVVVEVAIAFPMAYPEAGMYPTSYVMAYDLVSDEYTVAMTGFEYFPQSTSVKNVPCPDGGVM